MGSMRDLVTDLWKKEPSLLRDGLITQAEAGVFDGPPEELHGLLAGALRRAGFADLAAKLEAGAYTPPHPDEIDLVTQTNRPARKSARAAAAALKPLLTEPEDSAPDSSGVPPSDRS